MSCQNMSNEYVLMPPTAREDQQFSEKPHFSLDWFVGQVNYALGEILTIVDASYGDPVQRKAVKDLVKKSFWGWCAQVERSVQRGEPGTLPTDGK